MTPPAAKPFYFGPEKRRLFGWLHLPANRPRHGLGVVICNPIGYEEICAHRSIRHFAEAAARAGIPAIRFDYDGIGDSAGSDLDPGRVAAWIASVNQAAEALRAHTGVEHFCFLGVRLGALLASLAALERTDVKGLAALAPIVSARAWLREMKALQRMMGEAAQEPADGLFETAGFILTPETQASLSALDLHKIERTPAPAVLLAERTDIAGNDRWAEQLTGCGASVDRLPFAGYTEMMLDSHETVVPDATIERVMAWMKRLADSRANAEQPAGHATAATPSHGAETMVDCDVREDIVRFGPDSILFGILSGPRDAARQRRKGVLLLNSGAVHRVGPNRLYVTLARQWASLGYTVLRMDLSGLGDSPQRPGEAENVVYSAHALSDVGAALKYLRDTHQLTDIRAMGICSGAYHAFKAAVAGAPLSGVTLINPLTFFWKAGVPLKYPEHHVVGEMKRYSTNMWRLESWKKMFAGQVDLRHLFRVLVKRLRSIIVHRARAVLSTLRVPLPEDLRKELRTLARRRVDMSFVFADRDPGLALLTEQGGSTVRHLQSRGALDIHIVQDANHTFTNRDTRTRLQEILTGKFVKLPHQKPAEVRHTSQPEAIP